MFQGLCCAAYKALDCFVNGEVGSRGLVLLEGLLKMIV